MAPETLIDNLRGAITALDADEAEKVCRTILSEGIDPQLALTDGAIRGLREVGSLFEKKTYFLPELMLSVKVMETVRDILEPEIIRMNKDVARKGTILMGTVWHDIHDIGKKIVIAMLRGVGFGVVDLGNSVSPDTFVAKARELKPDIVGMSALLTTTMPYAETTVRALRDAGVPAGIIVGGAPVTKEYADRIGARYAENASEACRVCASLVTERAS